MVNVQTGDLLTRGHRLYKVIVADTELFVTAIQRLKHIDYSRLAVYSNNPRVAGLSDRGFVKLGERRTHHEIKA